MSGLFGTPTQVAVERGLAEFRSGRPVILTWNGERTLVLPVDGMTDQTLVAFKQLCAPARPRLLVTARRGRALGLNAIGSTGLAIGDIHDRAAVFSLAADAQVTRHLEVVPSGETASAAIELAKLAQLLPALLFCEAGTQPANASEAPLVTVAADATKGKHAHDERDMEETSWLWRLRCGLHDHDAHVLSAHDLFL